MANGAGYINDSLNDALMLKATVTHVALDGTTTVGTLTAYDEEHLVLTSDGVSRTVPQRPRARLSLDFSRK